MSRVALTKMSSRGQIVIPQEIREQLHIKEGDAFAVTGKKDTLLLRRITMPSKDELLHEWKRLVTEGNKRVKKPGIKENDVPAIVHRFRGVKE